MAQQQPQNQEFADVVLVIGSGGLEAVQPTKEVKEPLCPSSKMRHWAQNAPVFAQLHQRP
jgi:hypothetical protein